MNRNRKSSTFCALAILGLGVLAPATHATTAITFDPTLVTSYNYNNTFTGTLGYAFSVSQNTTVTGLDYWVAPQDANHVTGFNHFFNIYTYTSSAPITSATNGSLGLTSLTQVLSSQPEILKGTSAMPGSSSSGGFATVGVTPFTLTANTNYLILTNTGATPSSSTGDPYVDHLTSSQLTTASGINYIDGIYGRSGASPGSINTGTNGANLHGEGGSGTDNGYFGPSFEIAPASASAAPEPSQVAMLAVMGLSVGGLMLRARRRKG